MAICAKMAKLAELAYLDGKQAKPKMKKLGYTGHKFFENDGAQCHAVWNKEEYVLAFRELQSDLRLNLELRQSTRRVGMLRLVVHILGM